MTNRTAIQKANDLRPNDIPDEVKAEWLAELELEFAELMGIEEPVDYTWPDETDLLVPFPQDKVYPLYLAAMIDNYNQEVSLFANDSTISNTAINDVRAWWRRNHRPEKVEIKL